jgi:O-antigen/teichoic acid export membrane protein
MITTPYMASVSAHEDMHIYAYISIIEAILRLIVAIILQLAKRADKLKLYGILILTITSINTFFYRFICTKKYKECKISFYWSNSLFKELSGYIGFVLFGQISSIARNQGIDVLINIAFGPLVNAARGIAKQVGSAVSIFAHNIGQAVYPQVIKSYAIGKSEEMVNISFFSSKIMFFLLAFFILPLQLELPFVFKIWLKKIPEFSLIFTRIILCEVLIESLTNPLSWCFYATGKIKIYQTIIGGIMLLNLPIVYIALQLGVSPINVQFIGLIIMTIGLLARIILLSMIKISFTKYISKVIIPVICTVVLGAMIPICFVSLYPQNIARFFITLIISSISIIVAILFIGLRHNERSIILKTIKAFCNKAKGLSIKYIGRFSRGKIRNYWDRYMGREGRG